MPQTPEQQCIIRLILSCLFTDVLYNIVNMLNMINSMSINITDSKQTECFIQYRISPECCMPRGYNQSHLAHIDALSVF